MKKNIILGLKGFVIGIANIIPGVSGGTLAITLGIYDKLINVISHFWKNIKENIKFLLPILIGAVIAIITLSKVISFAINEYPFPTILFFIGAILGGMPMLLGKVKNEKISIVKIIVFVATFSLIIGLTFIGSSNNVNLVNMNIIGYMLLFVVGIVASATMVIPGVSGSAVLMTLGYYEPIIGTIKNLTDFSLIGQNMIILIPFGIGIVLGIFLIARLIEYLFNHYENITYYGIIGFVLSSIISIIIQNYFVSGKFIGFSIIEFIIGIILFAIGFIIAYKLGDQ